MQVVSLKKKQKKKVFNVGRCTVLEFIQRLSQGTAVNNFLASLILIQLIVQLKTCLQISWLYIYLKSFLLDKTTIPTDVFFIRHQHLLFHFPISQLK